MGDTLTFDAFRRGFGEKVDENEMTWEVIGFVTPEGTVYPFGTDTKVLSTVFEALSVPLIQQVASEYGYVVEDSRQTIYPDFTLTPPSGKPPRIAIDIKTTYRRFNTQGNLQPFRYTLGSYTSFLRSPGQKKNIRYPYSEYGDHWIIGFVYTRPPGMPAKVHCLAETGQARCPYTDVEYFVQEKHRIVGLRPGSGNTTNIGSFPTRDIQDFHDGNGPFAALGKKMCDEYWRHYGVTADSRHYGTIEEFMAWREQRETQ